MSRHNTINMIAIWGIFLLTITSVSAQSSSIPETIDYFQGFRENPAAVAEVLAPKALVSTFHALPSVNATFFETTFPQLSFPPDFVEGEQATGGSPFYGDSSALPNFKVYDFTGDGQPDILYSGTYAYGEGGITLLWQQTEDNLYTRLELLPPPMNTLGHIVTIEHLDHTQPASFLIGLYACCAGYIDEFTWYRPQKNMNPVHYQLDSTIQLFWGTILPQIRIAPRPITTSHDKTCLRVSPIIFNRHDAQRSEIEAVAVYGNILAEFVQASPGIALGQQRDSQGELWYFVMMDGSDVQIGYTRFYDTYTHRGSRKCGWMAATDLTFTE